MKFLYISTSGGFISDFFYVSTFGGQIHDAAVPGDSCKGGNVDTAGRFDG